MRSVDWLCLAGTWKREPGETAIEDRFWKILLLLFDMCGGKGNSRQMLLTLCVHFYLMLHANMLLPF